MGRCRQQLPRVAARARACYSATHVGCGSDSTERTLRTTRPLLPASPTCERTWISDAQGHDATLPILMICHAPIGCLAIGWLVVSLWKAYARRWLAVPRRRFLGGATSHARVARRVKRVACTDRLASGWHNHDNYFDHHYPRHWQRCSLIGLRGRRGGTRTACPPDAPPIARPCCLVEPRGGSAAAPRAMI